MADDEPFEGRMRRLVAALEQQFAESNRLQRVIEIPRRGIGYGG